MAFAVSWSGRSIQKNFIMIIHWKSSEEALSSSCSIAMLSRKLTVCVSSVEIFFRSSGVSSPRTRYACSLRRDITTSLKSANSLLWPFGCWMICSRRFVNHRKDTVLVTCPSHCLSHFS